LENIDSGSSEGRFGENRNTGGYRPQRDYGGYGSRGRGGFAGPRPFRPSPVRVGEEFDVKIESMSKRGDAGVAKVEGLVIFVTGTKVGDSVRIRITKVGRGYATAEIAGASTANEEPGVGQPSTTADNEQPSTTADNEQPSTTADNEQPSTTADNEQPSTTADNEQPSTTS
jgi:predicted RNA-binding protein with TRAM domain